MIRCCESEADTTLLMVEGTVAAAVCGRRLRVQWPEEARPKTGGLESLPDFISLPRDAGPTYHSDVASDGAGRSQGGVGNGAGHARRCDPFDHTGAARHATHRGAVAANGAAQPPVVGEGRGRQADAGPVIASGWSQAS